MTVVIPSWQTRELLLGLLAGLGGGAEPDVRLVVVDNASTDGSADAVVAAFPRVTLIRRPANGGFARAVNAGLEHALASGDGPAVPLNADTRCSPGDLRTLARALEANPRAALVAPRLLTGDGVPQPYAFGGDPTLGYLLRRGWQRRVHRRYLHDWAPAAPCTVDWATFACVAMRLEAVRQVGLLDPRYFMYFEDNDWCLRARRAGWEIRLQPEATVVHFGGASLRQSPEAQRAYRHSLVAFYARHYAPWQRLALRVLLPLYARTGASPVG